MLSDKRSCPCVGSCLEIAKQACNKQQITIKALILGQCGKSAFFVVCEKSLQGEKSPRKAHDTGCGNDKQENAAKDCLGNVLCYGERRHHAKDRGWPSEKGVLEHVHGVEAGRSVGCHGDEADEKGVHVHGAERFQLAPARVQGIDGNGRIAEGDGGVDKACKEAGCQACRDSVSMGLA